MPFTLNVSGEDKTVAADNESMCQLRLMGPFRYEPVACSPKLPSGQKGIRIAVDRPRNHDAGLVLPVSLTYTVDEPFANSFASIADALLLHVESADLDLAASLGLIDPTVEYYRDAPTNFRITPGDRGESTVRCTQWLNCGLLLTLVDVAAAPCLFLRASLLYYVSNILEINLKTRELKSYIRGKLDAPQRANLPTD